MTSRELRLIRLVEKFGVKAIFGKDTLPANEVIKMLTADHVLNSYNSRKEKPWGEWAREHPGDADLLHRAERLASGEE